MKINLTDEYTNAIDKQQLDMETNVIINDTDISAYAITAIYDFNRKFGISQANVELANTNNLFRESFILKKGDNILISETVNNQSFDKFNGIIDQISFNEAAGVCSIICLDDLVRIKNTDISISFDGGGDIGGTKIDNYTGLPIKLKPNFILDDSGNETHLSQIFDFVDISWVSSGWAGVSVDSIATTPPPSIRMISSSSLGEYEPPEFNINYQTGQLVFSTPINLLNYQPYAYFSYYVEGMQVEDIIKSILQEDDGYGNTLFEDSDFISDFETVTGFVSDTLVPNDEEVTIDDTVYAIGQVWYLSFDNITSYEQFNILTDFTLTDGNIDTINIKFGAIILTSAINPTTNTVLCVKSDYEFYTLQSTYVELPYFKTEKNENRLDVIQRIKDNFLAPNYILSTRGDGKIWGQYIHQSDEPDYELNLLTDLNYVGDKDIYTRMQVFGKNNSPINVMYEAEINKYKNFTNFTDGAPLTQFIDYYTDHDILVVEPSDAGISYTNIRTNPSPPVVFAGDSDNLSEMVQLGRTDLGLSRIDSDDIELIIKGTVAVGLKTPAHLYILKEIQIWNYDSELIASVNSNDEHTFVQDGNYIVYKNPNIPDHIYRKVSFLYGYLFTNTTYEYAADRPRFYITNPSFRDESQSIDIGDFDRSTIYEDNGRWRFDRQSTNRYRIRLHGVTAFPDNPRCSKVKLQFDYRFDEPKIINSFNFSLTNAWTDVLQVIYYNNNEVVGDKTRYGGVFYPRTLNVSLPENKVIDRVTVFVTVYHNNELVTSNDDHYFRVSKVEGFGDDVMPLVNVVNDDYIANFWYDADINIPDFEGQKDNIRDGNLGDQLQIILGLQPLQDIPLLDIDFESDKFIDTIDFVNGFFLKPDAPVEEKYGVGTTYSLYYSTETGLADTITWIPLCDSSLYFSLNEGQSISFNHDDLNGGFNIRRLKLVLNNVERVDESNYWVVSINEISAYQNVILTGEARLTDDRYLDSKKTKIWENDYSLVYDDGQDLLTELQDVVLIDDKIREDFMTQSQLNELAYHILREYVKKNTQVSGTAIYQPHLQIGDTVSCEGTNYMIESLKKLSFDRMEVNLGRYGL